MQFHLIVELWRHKFSFYSELHFLPFKNWFISIITFNVTRLIRDLYLSFTLQEIEKNFYFFHSTYITRNSNSNSFIFGRKKTCKQIFPWLLSLPPTGYKSVYFLTLSYWRFTPRDGIFVWTKYIKSAPYPVIYHVLVRLPCLTN